MRHRIKAGKIGSFTPEKQKVEVEQLAERELAEEVEEIFEDDSNISNDDEALTVYEAIISKKRTDVSQSVSLHQSVRVSAI